MSTENLEPTGQAKAEVFSSAAVARRRLLLKGVGKGTAVLVAAVPIQTLAGQSLLTFDGLHQCSISGMQSGVHSATPSNTPVCGGYSISHWALSDGSNPPKPPSGRWPSLPSSWTYATHINSVLSPNSLTGNPTLFQVMNAFASTPEAHWICAWLNALWEEQHVGTLKFPYTATQVLDFYNLPAAPRADALLFFTTYMERNP